MPSSRISLRQLLKKANGEFLVPDYQRRYIWGQHRHGEKDSAAFLSQCLNKSKTQGQPYFLQGITITGTQPCVLVDGQQRLTFLCLLLKWLGCDEPFSISYACRQKAQEWLVKTDLNDIEEKDTDTQDIYFFKKTLRTIASVIDPEITADFILDNVYFLCIELTNPADGLSTFKMMNATKLAMRVPDIIKADIMRLASNPAQPHLSEYELYALRQRYAAEWESWARWWSQPLVKAYYTDNQNHPLELLLQLCIRTADNNSPFCPLTFEEYNLAATMAGEEPWHFAKRFFLQLRAIQKRFEDAYADVASYNRIRAILLLQQRSMRFVFLKLYFADCKIKPDELEKYYKLSFLGMSIEEILHGDDPEAKFDDMIASLSMPDVYHTDAKRDVFNLLLRLNIDEDIKLQRRFDFSIWDNRSLEHIYSKSKVWHVGANGELLDGNDNNLNMSRKQVENDPSFLHRDKITNYDGVLLSEHCIGNLVLLYGNNNAAFGNASFDQKKLMFLTPGSLGVFQSRNLLHSVCVFAGNAWSDKSIVENYNLTLKNLKLYYGYK